MPNFTALDISLPEVATLVAAMVQARDAVSRRSWSHPQEPTGEAWWPHHCAGEKDGPRLTTSHMLPNLTLWTTLSCSNYVIPIMFTVWSL